MRKLLWCAADHVCLHTLFTAMTSQVTGTPVIFVLPVLHDMQALMACQAAIITWQCLQSHRTCIWNCALHDNAGTVPVWWTSVE